MAMRRRRHYIALRERKQKNATGALTSPLLPDGEKALSYGLECGTGPEPLNLYCRVSKSVSQPVSVSDTK